MVALSLLFGLLPNSRLSLRSRSKMDGPWSSGALHATPKDLTPMHRYHALAINQHAQNVANLPCTVIILNARKAQGYSER